MISEYQKIANPTQATVKLLEFYGGGKRRIDEGVEMSRCIQHLVEEELVQNYQRDLMPDEETRNPLEYAVGMNWREDQGVEGRSCIMRILTEEWKNIKPSILRYHRELMRELEEGWIQSLRTELEPAVQRLFRQDWKEEAEKYLHNLKEEERKMCHNTTK